MTHSLPAYWLPRPAFDLAPHREVLEDALRHALATGAWPDVSVPAWQALCWLADERGYLLHGGGASGLSALRAFRPRDVNEFGARDAVYAASDGIWPIFFAVIDRPRVSMGISNAAIRLEERSGELGEPHYFFSMTGAALARRPFRPGWVYVLARDGFDAEPPRTLGEARVHLHHWAGPDGVRPLFSVPVTPHDFPLLNEIRGHDDEEVARRASADPDGFPWLDEPVEQPGQG